MSVKRFLFFTIFFFEKVNKPKESVKYELLNCGVLICYRCLRLLAAGRTAAYHVSTLGADIFSCSCCQLIAVNVFVSLASVRHELILPDLLGIASRHMSVYAPAFAGIHCAKMARICWP